jgi:hypothetical protein
MCGEGQLSGGGEKLSSYDVELPASSGRRSFEDCNECGIVLITETAPGRLPRDIGHDDHLVRDVSALRLLCSCACTEDTLERRRLLPCSVAESVVHKHPAGSTLQLGALTHIIRDERQATRTCTIDDSYRKFAAPGTEQQCLLCFQERNGHCTYHQHHPPHRFPQAKRILPI